jgi:hypothetical protein
MVNVAVGELRGVERVLGRGPSRRDSSLVRLRRSTVNEDWRAGGEGCAVGGEDEPASISFVVPFAADGRPMDANSSSTKYAASDRSALIWYVTTLADGVLRGAVARPVSRTRWLNEVVRNVGALVASWLSSRTRNHQAARRWRQAGQ